MQQLCATTTSPPSRAAATARDVLAAVPPMIWFIRRQMKPHRSGLSLSQFRVLVFVNARPHASLSQLAENLGASLPTTSRIVAGLVTKRLLARKGCNNDRRQLQLAITRRGKSMLDAAWSTARNKIEAELAPLSDLQRHTIAEAMQLLQGIFGTLDLPDTFDGDLIKLPVA